jgi:hypothetical protein
MNTLPLPSVRDRFFDPLQQAVDAAVHTRKCQDLADLEFLKSGVGRCLTPVQSGRDWVQRLYRLLRRQISVNCFFKSLRSERRLRLIKEVNEMMVRQCDRAAVEDPFADHEELADFAIYAADGHYHRSSTHEQPIDGKRRPVGHFFSLNLRSRSLRHLDIARPDRAKGKKSEHDIRALRRLGHRVLRMGQAAGIKVLIVYDKAIVDFSQWYKWKQGSGIYVLTREKANMALDVIGLNDFDRRDPRNRGVVADQLVGHSKGTAIRRVIYTDPVGGTTYHFITNVFNVPPGLIAYLYKRRWDVEKLFDELKNKLAEGKAWAKTATAKCQQGNFLALAHNLMLRFERDLADQHGIVDEKMLIERQAQLAAHADRAKHAGRQINPLLISAKKPTQRSLQFLRWLRTELISPSPWYQALDILRPLMLQYMR